MYSQMARTHIKGWVMSGVSLCIAGWDVVTQSDQPQVQWTLDQDQ